MQPCNYCTVIGRLSWAWPSTTLTVTIPKAMGNTKPPRYIGQYHN
jgi:hypothetical protein